MLKLRELTKIYCIEAQRECNILANDAEGKVAATWMLSSGEWTALPEQLGFKLETTSLRHAAADISPIDTRVLFRSGYSLKHPEMVFPPEFKYSPFDGNLLAQYPSSGGSSPNWIAPYGGPSITDKSSRTLRGLDQTLQPLKLARDGPRTADDEPEHILPCPPPGVYDYLSLPLGSSTATLLAIDPNKGALYALLEGSMQWAQLEHNTNGILAESIGDRMDWRCEALIDGSVSRLFIATSHGLACVVIDIAALSFGVVYSKCAALGSPIEFAGHIWCPCAVGDRVCFTSMTRDGKVGPTVESAISSKSCRRVCSPLADGRKAIWMTETGQLILQRLPDGEFATAFYAWPKNVMPSFDFGCPYLSRDGTTWQLCQDISEGHYLYVQLGSEQPSMQETMTPRFCTGTINYRFAAKLKSEPWVEPEVGVDGAGLVIPVLEHASTEMAVGLRIESTAGLEEVINSSVPRRAVLQFDKSSTVTDFYTLAVAKPWHLRLVSHDRKLWLSHPQLKYLAGWELQA